METKKTMRGIFILVCFILKMAKQLVLWITGKELVESPCRTLRKEYIDPDF